MIFNKEYETGLEEVDLQHAKIDHMAINLIDSLMTGKPIQEKDFPQVMDKLYNLVKEHFQYEEDLMIKYAFPDIIKHTNSHEITLSKLTKLNASIHTLYVNKNKNNQLHKQILDSCSIVKDLFLEHIKDEDKKMAQFILKKVKK